MRVLRRHVPRGVPARPYLLLPRREQGARRSVAGDTLTRALLLRQRAGRKVRRADDGAAQKWLRSWRALPTGANNLTRTIQHSMQLDCETGVGLNSGQGSDPQVMLRWSDDGGHTFSNEHWKSMGAIGKYGKRTIWRRLGATMKIRDRVYEVSGTDPVRIYIMGAELAISGTSA